LPQRGPDGALGRLPGISRRRRLLSEPPRFRSDALDHESLPHLQARARARLVPRSAPRLAALDPLGDADRTPGAASRHGRRIMSTAVKEQSAPKQAAPPGLLLFREAIALHEKGRH